MKSDNEGDQALEAAKCHWWNTTRTFTTHWAIMTHAMDCRWSLSLWTGTEPDYFCQTSLDVNQPSFISRQISTLLVQWKKNLKCQHILVQNITDVTPTSRALQKVFGWIQENIIFVDEERQNYGTLIWFNLFSTEIKPKRDTNCAGRKYMK